MLKRITLSNVEDNASLHTTLMSADLMGCIPVNEVTVQGEVLHVWYAIGTTVNARRACGCTQDSVMCQVHVGTRLHDVAPSGADAWHDASVAPDVTHGGAGYGMPTASHLAAPPPQTNEHFSGAAPSPWTQTPAWQPQEPTYGTQEDLYERKVGQGLTPALV